MNLKAHFHQVHPFDRNHSCHPPPDHHSDLAPPKYRFPLCFCRFVLSNRDRSQHIHGFCFFYAVGLEVILFCLFHSAFSCFVLFAIFWTIWFAQLASSFRPCLAYFQGLQDFKDHPALPNLQCWLGCHPRLSKCNFSHRHHHPRRLRSLLYLLPNFHFCCWLNCCLLQKCWSLELLFLSELLWTLPLPSLFLAAFAYAFYILFPHQG